MCLGVYFGDTGIVIAPSYLKYYSSWALENQRLFPFHCDGTLAYFTLSQREVKFPELSFQAQVSSEVQCGNLRLGVQPFERRLGCGIKRCRGLESDSSLVYLLPEFNGKLVFTMAREPCGICVFLTPWDPVIVSDLSLGHYLNRSLEKPPVYRNIYSDEGELCLVFQDRKLIYRRYYPKDYVLEHHHSTCLSVTSEFTRVLTWSDGRKEAVSGRCRTFTQGVARAPARAQLSDGSEELQSKFLRSIPRERYLSVY